MRDPNRKDGAITSSELVEIAEIYEDTIEYLDGCVEDKRSALETY